MSEAKPRCWCGNQKLRRFAPEYMRCPACETLISTNGLTREETLVNDDESDFYGKSYWHEHQLEDLNLPSIDERARTDITERCVHWLKALVKYKLPPGDVLELGCAHGGFVAMMRMAGFSATGLEMSPSIVEYASTTFGVPVLCGPVEEQEIPKASLDVIVLMDVFEHLVDPLATMRHCLELLKSGGLLMIQCPRYEEGKSLKALKDEDSLFLSMLTPVEHLHLFSEKAVRQLFDKLGAKELAFEPAFFPQHDMFFVVSRKRLVSSTADQRVTRLRANSSSIFAQALIDLADRADREIGQEREERALERQERAIEQEETKRKLAEYENDRKTRMQLIEQLTIRLNASEEDRAARLVVLEELDAQVKASEVRVNEISALNHANSEKVRELEDDRSKRLQLIAALNARIDDLEADVGKRRDLVTSLERRSSRLEDELVQREHAHQEAIRGHQDTIENLQRELVRLTDENQAKDRQSSELRRQLESLEAASTANLTQLEELKADLVARAELCADLEEQSARMEDELKAVTEDSDRKSRENRRLGNERHQLLGERKQLVMENTKWLAELSTLLLDLQNAEAELVSLQEAAEQLRVRCSELEWSNAVHARVVAEMQVELTKYESSAAFRALRFLTRLR